MCLCVSEEKKGAMWMYCNRLHVCQSIIMPLCFDKHIVGGIHHKTDTQTRIVFLKCFMEQNNSNSVSIQGSTAGNESDSRGPYHPHLLKYTRAWTDSSPSAFIDRAQEERKLKNSCCLPWGEWIRYFRKSFRQLLVSNYIPWIWSVILDHFFKTLISH